MAREGGGAGWRQGRADFLGTVGAAEPICAVNWFPHLTPAGKAGPLAAGFFALIVYRLGQEILNLQSGVRFPVGAPYSAARLPRRMKTGPADTRRLGIAERIKHPKLGLRRG